MRKDLGCFDCFIIILFVEGGVNYKLQIAERRVLSPSPVQWQDKDEIIPYHQNYNKVEAKAEAEQHQRLERKSFLYLGKHIAANRNRN